MRRIGAFKYLVSLKRERLWYLKLIFLISRLNYCSNSHSKKLFSTTKYTIQPSTQWFSPMRALYTSITSVSVLLEAASKLQRGPKASHKIRLAYI